MKKGRKLSVTERKHASKSVGRVEDWRIGKKESDVWVLIHIFTGQAKPILAP